MVGTLSIPPESLAEHVCACVRDCDSSPIIDYQSVFSNIMSYTPILSATKPDPKPEQTKEQKEKVEEDDEITEIDPPSPPAKKRKKTDKSKGKGKHEKKDKGKKSQKKRKADSQCENFTKRSILNVLLTKRLPCDKNDGTVPNWEMFRSELLDVLDLSNQCMESLE